MNRVTTTLFRHVGETELPAAFTGTVPIFVAKSAKMGLPPSRCQRGQVHVFGLRVECDGTSTGRKMDQSPVNGYDRITVRIKTGRTTQGQRIGMQAKPSTRQLLGLSAAIVLFVSTVQLMGDEAAGSHPATEDRPAMSNPPSVNDTGEDRDWFDRTRGASPTEPAKELPSGAVPAMDAPVYPPFQEPCRASRVYRSALLGRLWARGEYLLWGMKGVDLPPLLTTSTLATAPEDAGVLGDPNTSVLFGDETIHDEMRSGGRFTLGWWWDPSQMGGVEATYFGLPVKALRHHAHGWGDQIVARPYLDVENDEQAADLVAYPGLLDGAVDVRADMELQGAELLMRRLVLRRPALRVDLLGGYRYGRLLDRLTITEQAVSLDAASGYDVDAVIDRYDLFKSTNDFHGGELGLIARWSRGCWSVRLSAKVALGGTDSRAIVDGATSVVDDQSSTDYVGGLLALPTNIGYHRDTEFAVLSELGVSIEYQLMCDLRISVGYDFLHWNHVGRAADQIDLGINPTQIPPDTLVGESRPEFAWRKTDFWAQGLSICLEQQF